MKHRRFIVCYILFLFCCLKVKASDSLTIAQSFINLKLTENYFDTLSTARLSKIISFTGSELETISDTAFIRQNRALYNSCYALLYLEKAKLLYRTQQNSDRQTLLQWKNALDSSMRYFNSMNASFEEENSFYQLVEFDKEVQGDLMSQINSTKSKFAIFFNANIYPDFKRIYYTFKKTNLLYVDSLSYFAGIFNLDLKIPKVETPGRRCELEK